MMKWNNPLFGIIFLVSFFTSCAESIYLESTSQASYSMDVLRPAGISLDSSTHTILVLPAKEKQNSHSLVILNNEKYASYDSVPAGMFFETCREAARIIEENPRLNALMPADDSSWFSPKLKDWNDIAHFCREAGVEGLAVLWSIDQQAKVSTSVSARNLYYAGSTSEVVGGTPVRSMDLTAEAEYIWYIYLPQSRWRGLHVIKTQHSQSGIELNGSEAEQVYIEQYLPVLLSDMNLEAAEKFSRYLTPYWERVVRTFYNKGNSEMRKAARLMLDEKHAQAAHIWEELAQSTKPGIARHALFNLLLLHELNGSYQQGLTIATRLEEKYNMPEANVYIAIFKQRMEEKELLKRQMLGEKP